MTRCCVACRWFKDAHYSRTYVTPRCTVRGDDDAAYMRQSICGLDGQLFEARDVTEHNGRKIDRDDRR